MKLFTLKRERAIKTMLAAFFVRLELSVFVPLCRLLHAHKDRLLKKFHVFWGPIAAGKPIQSPAINSQLTRRLSGLESSVVRSSCESVKLLSTSD